MGSGLGVGVFCDVCVEKSAVLGRKGRFWTANGRKFTQTCHAKGVVGIFEPSLKAGLQTGSGT